MILKIYDEDNQKEKLMFFEDESDSMKLGYEIGDILYEREAACGQRVMIFEHKDLGKTLVIDDIVQSSVNTEFLYNEIMAHLTLDCQKAPRRVLIIGGGTGLTMKQALKHPVDEAVLCDISCEILEIAEEYEPEAVEALRDPRAKVVIADGFEYVKGQKDLDGILVDSCDPVGPAKVLYSDEFYQNCIAALSGTGILCVQTGAPLFSAGRQEYRALMRFLRGRDDLAYKPVIFTCPMIVGGFYMFVLVTKNKETDWFAHYHIARDDVEYYDPELRAQYFDIPNFIRKKLETGLERDAD